MMQELELQQEKLQKEAERWHQQALEEIIPMHADTSSQNMEIMAQGGTTGSTEDPLEDLINLKQEFTSHDYWNSFN